MSQPRPISTAAQAVIPSPIRVRALGVIPRRWMAVTSLRAPARTHSWNRWVNIAPVPQRDSVATPAAASRRACA